MIRVHVGRQTPEDLGGEMVGLWGWLSLHKEQPAPCGLELTLQGLTCTLMGNPEDDLRVGFSLTLS